MPTPTALAELVRDARTGSGEALAELYARYGSVLMALAFRLTGSRADAEDVLHDVFLGLPEALSHYDERGAFGSWLKRIAIRVALTRMRSRERAREVSLDDEVLVAPADAPVDELLDLAAVQRAIAALPDTLRAVVVLRAIEGHSHAEIAALLDISPNASEVRLHRALRSLRQTLGATP
jgi:RNA polymerase sigma-70 factor (ECF subfamily)